MKKYYLYTAICLLLLILILFIKTNKFPQFCNIASPISLPSELILDPAVKEEFLQTFTRIYDNNIVYNQAALGTPKFTQNYPNMLNRSSANVSIDVIQYTPNMTIEEGYEGLRWTRNVGKEVDDLLRTDPGKQIIQNNDSYSILTTKLYPSRYSYQDGFFPPSRSYDRSYKMINTRHHQLITVTVSVQKIGSTFEDQMQGEEICYQKKCAILYTPSREDAEVFEQVEYLIQESIPQDKL